MTNGETRDPGSAHLDYLHTGPGTLAGRYLRCFWQPIFRSQDLDRGQAIPVRLMSQDFTLYRGESGETFLVDPRCAHRRTQLSLGWVEGDCLRCFYHGWMYDGAGQCVEQPAESPAFTKSVRIGSYPTREYIGLVFAYLGEGDPPELPRHPEFEGPGFFEVDTIERPCNYFRHMELDPVHIAFVHRESPETAAGLSAVPAVRCTETSYGYTVVSARRTEDGQTVEQVQHRLMPNMALFKMYPEKPGGAWRDLLAWRVPVDDDYYVGFSVRSDPDDKDHETISESRYWVRSSFAECRKRDADAAALAKAVLDGRLSRDQAERQTPDVVFFQDTLVLLSQPRVADRLSDASEQPMPVLHHIWERELRKLDAGAPLTEWLRPAHLTTTSGAVV